MHARNAIKRLFPLLALLLAAAFLAAACGDAQLNNSSESQEESEKEKDDDDDEDDDEDEIEGEDPDAIPQAIEFVEWQDAGEAASHFVDDGVARLETEQPFQSVHFMIKSSFPELSYRLIDELGDESDWETLEVEVFNEDFDPDYYQGLIVADAPAVELQLRAPDKVDYAKIEFFEDELDEDYSFDGTIDD